MIIIYKIWFSNLLIDRKEKLKVLEKYSEKELWYMNRKKLEEEKITEKNICEILNESNKIKANKMQKIIESNNIHLIKYSDNIYPKKLKNIDDFPIYLYIRGNLKLINQKNLAIVGARNASTYGKGISRKLAYELAERNINIVSGLAIGIDKQAHLGALDSRKGKTIAILATSVLEKEMYPIQNLRVFQRILEQGGAIISEYPFGGKIEKYRFIERNRIISGLSDKIIVIEASEKSGSLITADFALEQGKDIFVVPRKYKFKKFCR